MGISAIKIAVTDAGPLIHLNEIGCLKLLSVFEELHIPNAVWSETVEKKRVSQVDILALGIIQRHELSQVSVSCFAQEKGFDELQIGELECLYLCQRIKADILLTDDLAVRSRAKSLKLIPVGSLGFIIKTYQLGCISLSEAKIHINNLYDVSSLYVTRTIVELAIEKLQKKI